MNLALRVPNPISLVSRWKILDNLRRSLVEPATFRIVSVWLVCDGPSGSLDSRRDLHFVRSGVGRVLLWTYAGNRGSPSRDIARDAVSNLFATNFTVLLTLTLLAHQTLLSLDAVGRALVRRLVTRERLLEWETAAEAELGKTPHSDRSLYRLDAIAGCRSGYLDLVDPPPLFAGRCTHPVLCGPAANVWCFGSMRARWSRRPKSAAAIRGFLRKSALHIWRYFAEFSNAEHNWLVPDNVQDNRARLPPAFPRPTSASF